MLHCNGCNEPPGPSGLGDGFGIGEAKPGNFPSLLVEMTYHCSAVERTSPQQRATLDLLERTCRRVFVETRQVYPNGKVWGYVLGRWDGRVLLGSQRHVPEYVPETGCLVIGLDADGSRDLIPRLTARLLAEVTMVTAGNRGCVDELQQVLDVARRADVPLEMSCDDIRQFGLTDSTWWADKHCGDSQAENRQMSFAELVGRDLDEGVALLRKTYPHLLVATRRWDMLDYAPQYGAASPSETVIVWYEARSNKIVLPEPHLASMENWTGPRQHCFRHPEHGQCIGVPARVDPRWDQLKGKLLTDAHDTLKWTYPHALIEAVPTTYRPPRTHRRDRIRVVFDPTTALVREIVIG